MSTWSDFASKVKGSSSRSSEPYRKEGKAKARDEIGPVAKGKSHSHDADLYSLATAKRARCDDLKSSREKRAKQPSPLDSRDKRQSRGAGSSPTSGQLREVEASLKRKAKLYDQLQRGKTAGLTEERIHDSLVDWDRKGLEQDELTPVQAQRSVEYTEAPDKSWQGVRDSGAEDNVGGDEQDAMIEYEDEFGRTRMVRQSEMPRSMRLERQRQAEAFIDDSLLSYGPQTSFPVYRPESEQRAASSSATSRVPDHFDARQDNRYRGAGFFQFSQDEETRKRQMRELRQEREETVKQRSQSFRGER